MSIPLQQETASLIEGNKNNIQNLNLLLNRYIWGWNKVNGQWQLKDGVPNKESKDKSEFLKFLTSFSQKASSNGINKYLESYNKRQEELLSSYQEKSSMTLLTHWRLAVGLGAKGALEIGLTLHHLYGFPYIPASSLKGLARAAAFLLNDEFNINLKFMENFVENTNASKYLQQGETEKLRNVLSYKDNENNKQLPTDTDIQRLSELKESLEQIRLIFGNQEQAGKVIFFDGLPESFPKLETDIINVHYQKYYSEGQPPGDWMSPVPTLFLTVAPNTQFNFAVASKEPGLHTKAMEWLKGGLTQLGIGGKTSAGYGYFTENGNNPIAPTIAIPKGLVKAEIIDVKTKPPMVKILEGKYINTITTLPGIFLDNLGLSIGSIIYVLPILDPKKKVQKAEYKGPVE